MGIVKEHSTKGTALLEQASGQQSVKAKMEEEVSRLQPDNKQLKNKMSQQQCYLYGGEKCPQMSCKRPKMFKMQKMNHFAKVCRFSSKGKKSYFGQLSGTDESDSEESSGRLVVGKLHSWNIDKNYSIRTPKCSPCAIVDACNRHRNIQESLQFRLEQN